jgi:hypothetical protein
MNPSELEQIVKDSNQRIRNIEQILPPLATKEGTEERLRTEVARLATKGELQAEFTKLATKEELQAEFTKLATKEELQAEFAKLATKEELRAVEDTLRLKIEDESRQTRSHFDIVAEDLRGDIRRLAESIAGVSQAHDMRFTALGRQIADHETRILRLEATRRRRPS